MTEQTIILMIFAFAIGYILADFIHEGKKFKVEVNQETGEARIVPIDKPKQKMEFVGEADRKEIEEIERPGAFQNFLGTFKKPAKKEEEEEI